MNNINRCNVNIREQRLFRERRVRRDSASKFSGRSYPVLYSWLEVSPESCPESMALERRNIDTMRV
jgi:hypothetical protein